MPIIKIGSVLIDTIDIRAVGMETDCFAGTSLGKKFFVIKTIDNKFSFTLKNMDNADKVGNIIMGIKLVQIEFPDDFKLKDISYIPDNHFEELARKYTKDLSDYFELT